MLGTESTIRRGLAFVVGMTFITGLVASTGAESLPRIDGPLTLDRAVDLAVAQSLRVRAAGADARTMESMRREAQAPFWPQLSSNGYLVDQRMSPNVYTSAGSTMARNYQVFDADRSRDANVTLMYPIFSGGRDYYGYQAAARRVTSSLPASSRIDAAGRSSRGRRAFAAV